MKPIFFLIPLLVLLSISLIPYSFAEIEKGYNYDKEILKTYEDGSQKIKFTSKPDRILVNGNYQDFRFTDNDTHLILETQHGSIKLNKSTCSFDFYKKGIIANLPIFSDSIVSKLAINGTENWNEITEISNAICETYGSKDQLVAKKYASNIGFIEYKYINTGTEFKTQLEITNLSKDTDKKYGFTQTINLNQDSIQFGNIDKNLDILNNQTLNRIWLESNPSEIINFQNGLFFDLDLSFPKLKSIYVLDPGKSKSKLSFNYLLDSKILLFNETMIIDPTFGYNSGTTRDITDNSCDGSANLEDAYGYVGANSGPSTCHLSAYYFDITSIPDIATIQNVNFRFDNMGETYSASTVCLVKSIEGQTSSLSMQALENDIKDGTLFATLTTECRTPASNDRIVDLGSSADLDLQNELSTDNEWGLGIYGQNYADLQLVAIRNPELEVTYITTLAPNAITNLSASSITQTTATLSFSAPNLNGESLINYMLNVTTPQASTATTFHSNTTNTTINLTGLTLGTGYTAQASAFTLGGANWTYANVLNFTTSTYNPPSAPTLSALSESDSSVRFISTNGTTNDFNMFYYGLRCLENSETSWTTIVSNSSIPDPRVYSYTLNPGDYVTCQWRDGSLAGFSDWSNNATETTGQIGIIQDARSSNSDALMNFTTWIEDEGGLYFGMGVFPMVIMLIGFMATKATVRIFTIITLMAMGIIHASGFFVYPDWYWTLAILFGIVLVLGRQARD